MRGTPAGYTPWSSSAICCSPPAARMAPCGSGRSIARRSPSPRCPLPCRPAPRRSARPRAAAHAAGEGHCRCREARPIAVRRGYAKAKRPAEKEKLITQLLTQAGDESATATDRCAVLQESLRLAAEASLTPTALRGGGPASMRRSSFRRPCAKRPRPGSPRSRWRRRTRRAWRSLPSAGPRSCGRRHGSTTRTSSRVAGRAAVESHCAETVEAAEALLARVQTERERWTAFEAATLAFANKPDDPLPHVAIGRYLCFTKGDWAKGVPHFAKGPDGPLKEAAAELAATPDAAAIAEAWLAGGREPAPGRPAPLPGGGTVFGMRRLCPPRPACRSCGSSRRSKSWARRASCGSELSGSSPWHAKSCSRRCGRCSSRGAMRSARRVAGDLSTACGICTSQPTSSIRWTSC